MSPTNLLRFVIAFIAVLIFAEEGSKIDSCEISVLNGTMQI